MWKICIVIGEIYVVIGEIYVVIGEIYIVLSEICIIHDEICMYVVPYVIFFTGSYFRDLPIILVGEVIFAEKFFAYS